MSLDLRSLVAVAGAMFGVVAALLLGFALYDRRRYPGEMDWGWGYVALFASLALISLRGYLPDFVTAVIGDAGVLSALVLIVIGLERFHDIPPSLALYAPLTVLAAAVLFVFALITLDTRARILTLELAGAAALCHCAIRILTKGRRRQSGSTRFVVGLVFLTAGVLLVRLAGLPSISSPDWMRTSGQDALFVIALAACLIGLALSLRWMVAVRLQDELQRSLTDRDLLLKEMHHRTKNDLALVQSLLNLDTIPDAGQAPIEERLGQLRSRIRAVGLVHESLSSLGAVRDVRLDSYLSLLASELGAADPLHSVETELETVVLDSRRAVAVGIIVNELAVNALRHAFPGRREGRVRISLARRAPDRIVVTVLDDGHGKAEGGHPAGFGSELVAGLAEELGGELKTEVAGGTRVELTFPSV